MLPVTVLCPHSLNSTAFNPGYWKLKCLLPWYNVLLGADLAGREVALEEQVKPTQHLYFVLKCSRLVSLDSR